MTESEQNRINKTITHRQSLFDAAETSGRGESLTTKLAKRYTQADPALKGTMPADIENAIRSHCIEKIEGQSGFFREIKYKGLESLSIEMGVTAQGKKVLSITDPKAHFSLHSKIDLRDASDSFAHLEGQMQENLPEETSIDKSKNGYGLTLSYKTDTWRQMMEGLNTIITSLEAKINITKYEGPEYELPTATMGKPSIEKR